MVQSRCHQARLVVVWKQSTLVRKILRGEVKDGRVALCFVITVAEKSMPYCRQWVCPLGKDHNRSGPNRTCNIREEDRETGK